MLKNMVKLQDGLALSLIGLLLSASVVLAQKSDATVDVYQINLQKSDIRLLIYRGGVLSTFGHNHVVSVGDLKGTIHLHSELAQSSVELEIPVNRLLVDDPAARRQEGESFTSQPSKLDIEGTRANMLGKRLLNAKQHSKIKIKGTSGPVSNKNSALLNLTVELLGRTIKLSLPATLKLQGDQLEAAGALSLSHKQLGLKPFSALLGALRVADKMDFKFRVHAEKNPQ